MFSRGGGNDEIKELVKKSGKTGTERLNALKKLHELANQDENRLPMVQNYGVLGLCCKVIAADQGDARLLALKLLLRISLADGSEMPMVQEPGLVDRLKAVSVSDDSSSREQACNLISNLVYDKDTREPLVHDHNILPTLIEFHRYELKHSLTALQRMAFNDDLRATMIREPGLMPLLNTVSDNESDDMRELSLDTIESLACDRNQCKPLVEKGVLPILLRAAELRRGKPQLLALKGLHRLSEGNHCEMTMQKTPGLIDLLIKLFYDDDDEEPRKVILRTFWNLSSTNDVSILMANQPLLELEMECLRSDNEDFNKFSSTFFFNLVYECEPWIRKRLKELNVTESLQALLDKGDETAFKATACIAILIGAEEKDSVLTAKPQMIQMFIEGLIKVTESGSYLNGRWNKKNFLVPIQLLCISDKNKPGFCKSSPLVNQLVDIIKMCMDSDRKAVALCVDILLQISFYYEDHDDGSEKMLTLLNSDKSEVLKKLLSQVSQSNSFEKGVRQSAGNLSRNLFEPKVGGITRAASNSVIKRPASSPGQPAAPAAKHIMISYSWKLNKELVVQVGKKMRAAGVEVWRDEEGSSIVHAMSGSVDDTMAAAVENASDVVIFVSQAYKESANCQAEARYANKLCKLKKLRLHFVMVDQNYLDPEGWLGLMLGDALWFPCWSPNQVDEAVASLCKVIGKSIPKPASQPSASHSTPAAMSAPAATSTAPVPTFVGSGVVREGRSWDNARVLKWLEEEVKLPDCGPGFKKAKMTGASMEMLCHIKPSAEELKQWMLILQVGTMGEMLHLMTHARATFV